MASNCRWQKGAKEMLPVDNVDSKEFLTSLFEAMIEELPQPKKGYLFVHGRGGNKEEAATFAEIAVPQGFQVAGIDLPGHGERKEDIKKFVPWTVVPELKAVLSYWKERWSGISLRANSMGANFSMQAFADEKMEKAPLVSLIIEIWGG